MCIHCVGCVCVLLCGLLHSLIVCVIIDMCMKTTNILGVYLLLFVLLVLSGFVSIGMQCCAMLFDDY